MGNTRQLFASITKRLLAGFLLVGLLGGCEPLVKVAVQVDTCQAGGTGKVIDQLPPPGACSPTTVLTNPTDPNAFGDNYFNTSTRTVLSDHTHLCLAGGTNKICMPNPGSTLCGGVNKTCMTRFTPTSGNNGTCACGCPQ